MHENAYAFLSIVKRLVILQHLYPLLAFLLHRSDTKKNKFMQLRSTLLPGSACLSRTLALLMYCVQVDYFCKLYEATFYFFYIVFYYFLFPGLFSYSKPIQ